MTDQELADRLEELGVWAYRIASTAREGDRRQATDEVEWLGSAVSGLGQKLRRAEEAARPVRPLIPD